MITNYYYSGIINQAPPIRHSPIMLALSCLSNEDGREILRKRFVRSAGVQLVPPGCVSQLYCRTSCSWIRAAEEGHRRTIGGYLRQKKACRGWIFVKREGAPSSSHCSYEHDGSISYWENRLITSGHDIFSRSISSREFGCTPWHGH